MDNEAGSGARMYGRLLIHFVCVICCRISTPGLCEVEQGVHRLSHPNVNTLAFSPDNSILATAGQDATTGQAMIRLWHVPSGEYIRTLPGPTNLIPAPGSGTARVTRLQFLSDGQTLLSAAEDGTISFWDVSTGNLLHQISEPWFVGDLTSYRTMAKVPVTAIDVSADDQTTVAAWGPSIQIWSTFERNQKMLFGAKDRTTEFSPHDIRTDFEKDQEWIERLSKYFAVRRPEAESSPWLLWHNSYRYSDVAFVPGHNWVLAADEITEVWDAVSGLRIKTFDGCYSIVSPNGELIAGTSPSQNIQVINVETETLIREFSFEGRAIEFGSDNRSLFVAGDGRISLVDIQSGVELETYGDESGYGHPGAVAVSKNGEFIAATWTQTGVNRIRLWNRDAK